jgi:hypothetical protein
VVLRGARHLVSLDAPVAFSRVLLEALATIEAAGSGRSGEVTAHARADHDAAGTAGAGGRAASAPDERALPVR